MSVFTRQRFTPALPASPVAQRAVEVEHLKASLLAERDQLEALQQSTSDPDAWEQAEHRLIRIKAELATISRKIDEARSEDFQQLQVDSERREVHEARNFDEFVMLAEPIMLKIVEQIRRLDDLRREAVESGGTEVLLPISTAEINSNRGGNSVLYAVDILRAEIELNWRKLVGDVAERSK